MRKLNAIGVMMPAVVGRCESGRLGRRRLAAICTAAAMLLMLATVSAQAGTGVAWDLSTSANTTGAAGGQITYYVHATNVGDTDTDGSQVTLTVTLPPALTLADASAFDPDWDCSSSVVGTTTATCTSTAVLAARVGPQLTPTVSITANIDPVAAGVRTTAFAVAGGAAANPTATTADPILITSDQLGFGIDGFDGQAADVAGQTFTQAGGHPTGISTEIDFNRGVDPRRGATWPVAPVKDVVVDLPPGLVGNPTATGGLKCTASQLANSSGLLEQPLCPAGSQVGTALIVGSGGGGLDVNLGPVSVFNMVPPPNVPARFGFNIAGNVITLNARLRSGGDYGLSVDVANTPEALAIIGTRLTFWGVPADPSHDRLRSCPGQSLPYQGGPSCTTDMPPLPFLRLPTSCTAPAGSPVTDGLVTGLHIDSWFDRGRVLADGSPDLSDPAWKSASFVSHDLPGFPASPDDPSTPWGARRLPTGCDKVPFDPTLDGAPAGPAVAGAPEGYAFDLALPQNEIPDAIGEADLRTASVTLPPGVRVSPSSATGLGACTQSEVALHSTTDATCPDSSELGMLTITTPLLDEPLTGAIYLATPHDNPFGTLISIYLVAKGPGLVVKLAGRIDPDPNTGRLTAKFDDNPQVPFSQLHLQFKDGPRAPLANPVECGRYTTEAQLTSWSEKTVDTSSAFTVSQDGHGAPCPARGFAPDFRSGVQNPIAGASSPFLLTLSRDENQQELSGLTVDVPKGVLGRIAQASLCSDSSANAGTCSDASKIGSVTVGAGAGPNPFYIDDGRAYITGPYKGGPFGLSIVVPAVAGPFDLGNVVVRAVIHVDPTTAALRVVSDPFPTIRQGIPLDVRDVRVVIDKPGFMVNPTNCDAKSVLGKFQSTSGTIAHGSMRFQVADCGNLKLAPKITFSVGAKHRTAAGISVPFTTTIRQTPGQSNLRKVSVSLPTTLNARLDVVNKACTLEVFHAGHCEKARAGTATVVTPLLRDPLKGGVYFVKNGRALPDLMVALRGQVSLDLDGKVTIPGGKHLATTFDTIPDAAITSFRLSLVAGAQGPVGAVVNLCTAKARKATASVGIRGQNGDLIRSKQRLKVNGCVHKKAQKPKTKKR